MQERIQGAIQQWAGSWKEKLGQMGLTAGRFSRTEGKAAPKKGQASNGSPGIQDRFDRFQAKRAFNGRTRADLYEDLAAFQDAGIPPFSAMQSINEIHHRQRRSLLLLGKKTKKPLWRMSDEWIRTIEKGGTVADALAPWADPAEVTMIAAGEESGELSEALRETSRLTRARGEMIKTAIGKLIMPVILLAALFGFVFYISATIVPTARELLPPDQMPWLASAYFGFGEWMLTYGPGLLIAFGVLVAVIFGSMPVWRGRYRNWADKVFPWTFYRMMQSAFFLLTLSAMLRAGIPPMKALTGLKKYARPWMAEHLERMMTRLRAGEKETQALDSGLLMDSMSDRLYIYSRLPDFSVVMNSLGGDAIKDLRENIVKVTTAVSTAAMLALALFVVATVFSLGQVSFSIQGQVDQQEVAP
ncbi:type II secretion system F family protein [Thioalkalivibrio sp. ALE19]|uniref:type II secretion system F family protein n=1 Tax=Thioalkalivibrio sp. ALE19 TaxID=1266909 RepID=UPI00040AC1D5|nr:type II secretion system F family protein [Thioalkalivibrio sp. ALE19]